MTCHSEHSKGGDGSKPKRTMCSTHSDTPSEQQCKRCRKHYCPNCLNSQQKCFNCASAEKDRGTQALKGPGTGKLKGGTKQGFQMPALPVSPQVIVGVVGIAVMGGLAYVGWGKFNVVVEPYKGPASIRIVAPLTKVVSGNAMIKLRVSPEEDLEVVELTIDGKYWGKFREPPFEVEWQTAIHGNGKHTVRTRAIFRGRKVVAVDEKKFTVKNKKAP